MFLHETATTNDNPNASRRHHRSRTRRKRYYRKLAGSGCMVPYHEKNTSIVPCGTNLVGIGIPPFKFQSLEGARQVQSQWTYIRPTAQLLLSDKYGVRGLIRSSQHAMMIGVSNAAITSVSVGVFFPAFGSHEPLEFQRFFLALCSAHCTGAITSVAHGHVQEVDTARGGERICRRAHCCCRCL